MRNEQIKLSVNEIGDFLSRRDIESLSIKCLQEKYKIPKVDILILLGNSITYTIECVAKAYKERLCDKILICGGIGHSTDILRKSVNQNQIYRDIKTENKSEADIFYDIITKKYEVPKDKIIIENKSTNCGDNAIKAIEILDKLNIKYSSILLIQDPTMQRRSHACFTKHANSNVTVISYAPFIPKINEKLELVNEEIDGIWGTDRYLELIMGEIPRLRDDENGYGPNGKDFIDHVEIPKKIETKEKILKELLLGYKNREIK